MQIAVQHKLQDQAGRLLGCIYHDVACRDYQGPAALCHYHAPASTDLARLATYLGTKVLLNAFVARLLFRRLVMPLLLRFAYNVGIE